MDLWLRVAVGAFVIVAPTGLFLLFWNGLMRLRNDEWADEVTERQVQALFDTLPTGQPRMNRATRLPDDRTDGRSTRRVPEPNSRGPIDRPDVGRPALDRPDADRRDRNPATAASDDRMRAVACSACGEPNPLGVDRCWHCGSRLDDPDMSST